MPLDGYFLHFLTGELQGQLIGSRVEKVHQPSKHEVVLHLRGYRTACRLFLSASPNSPRLHITAFAPENPAKPPMLCMLLRKHLIGAKLRAVTQAGLDRTVFLDFDATNEIGDPVSLRLCVEIMAKHSNIILLDGSGTILDAVKRVDASQSSYRQVQPGLAYVSPPPQDKLDLRVCTAQDVLDRVGAFPEKTLPSALLNALQGASPLICRELASRCGGMDTAVRELTGAQKALLLRALDALRETLASGGAPHILCDEVDAERISRSWILRSTASPARPRCLKATRRCSTISISSVTGRTARTSARPICSRRSRAQRRALRESSTCSVRSWRAVPTATHCGCTAS